MKAIRRIKAMIRFQMKFPDDDEEEKGPVNYAPTYKLHPDAGTKFNPTSVSKMINTVLRDKLNEYEYSRFTAPKFAKLLTGVLNERVKEFEFPRYKFVTNVVIAENREQAVSVSSQCVWNASTDHHATGEYRRETFIAVASIHGVYME